MAYDIHLCRTRLEASTTSPVLSFGVQEHATLFCQNKEIFPEFPVTTGLSNYYADAVFVEEELNDLQVELGELEKILRNEKTAHSVVIKIQRVVEMAISQNLKILCFCD